MQRKSQAAMEFLMTYGWAVLVVLVVIGTLAYFGVLNPSNFVPETCQFPLHLNCEEHIVTTTPSDAGTIRFTIRNGGGKDLKILKINATNDNLIGTSCSFVSPSGVVIINGEAHDFTLNSSYGDPCTINHAYAGSAKKIKWKVKISYSYQGSSFVHSADGELLAKVEKA